MHLYHPQLAFAAIHLLRQNHISSPVGAFSVFQSRVPIILTRSRTGLTSKNDGVVCPCIRQKRRRCFITSKLGALWTAASQMLQYFYKNRPASSLFMLIILLCLTSRVTCLRSKIASVADVPSEIADTQTMDFCLDTDGERHGLFSSWQDSSSGCQCSCQPVGAAVISLCDDNCDNKRNEGSEDGHSLLSQNDEPYASLVHSAMPIRKTKVKSNPDKLMSKGKLICSS